jgi:hypothetical protein
MYSQALKLWSGLTWRRLWCGRGSYHPADQANDFEGARALIVEWAQRRVERRGLSHIARSAAPPAGAVTDLDGVEPGRGEPCRRPSGSRLSPRDKDSQRVRTTRQPGTRIRAIPVSGGWLPGRSASRRRTALRQPTWREPAWTAYRSAPSRVPHQPYQEHDPQRRNSHFAASNAGGNAARQAAGSPPGGHAPSTAQRSSQMARRSAEASPSAHIAELLKLACALSDERASGGRCARYREASHAATDCYSDSLPHRAAERP